MKCSQKQESATALFLKSRSIVQTRFYEAFEKSMSAKMYETSQRSSNGSCDIFMMIISPTFFLKINKQLYFRVNTNSLEREPETYIKRIHSQTTTNMAEAAAEQHGAVTSGWNVSLYSIQDTPPCCPYMVSINKTREYSSK